MSRDIELRKPLDSTTFNICISSLPIWLITSITQSKIFEVYAFSFDSLSSLQFILKYLHVLMNFRLYQARLKKARREFLYDFRKLVDFYLSKYVSPKAFLQNNSNLIELLIIIFIWRGLSSKKYFLLKKSLMDICYYDFQTLTNTSRY